MNTPKRIDDIRRLPARAVPKPRPLAHLAPYVPPTPVTAIKPSAWGPRRPAVADPTVHRIRPLPPPQSVPKPAARPKLLPPTPQQPKLSVPTPAKPAPVKATAPAPRTTPPKRSWWRRLLDLAQYPLVAGLALIAANNTTLGQWFVLAYAVFALVRGIRSQVSFGAALFLLIAIPVFQLLHQPGVAQNIAIYVYELLVVGTVQAVIELYKTRHHKRGRV